MFRVIPGFLWVKFNREGYGYYPNYSGRVWILSKLDPSKKKKKNPLRPFFFLLNPLHPLKTKALVGKVLPFSKKKKKVVVKKFMEKKPSSSSSKAVKMVIPSDVIAEE